MSLRTRRSLPGEAIYIIDRDCLVAVLLAVTVPDKRGTNEETHHPVIASRAKQSNK